MITRCNGYWVGAAVLFALTSCERREGESTSEAVTTDETEAARQRPAEEQVTAAPTAAREKAGQAAVVDFGGGLATCYPGAAVMTTIDRMANLADANGDGAVSKDEATALTNFVVGGAFFRADENADGTITPEEGRELRREFMNRSPSLEALLRSARGSEQKPLAAIADWANIDYGKPLKIDEARNAARELVGEIFAMVDDDKNGSIDQSEVRAAGQEGARALGRSAFAAADRNNDGALTKQELGWLVEQPVTRAFELSDADRNGRLSMDEASAALQQLSRWVGLPAAEASGAEPKPRTM